MKVIYSIGYFCYLVIVYVGCVYLLRVYLVSVYLLIDRLERVFGWCCWRTSLDALFAIGLTGCATGCVSMVPLG